MHARSSSDGTGALAMSVSVRQGYYMCGRLACNVNVSWCVSLFCKERQRSSAMFSFFWLVWGQLQLVGSGSGLSSGMTVHRFCNITGLGSWSHERRNGLTCQYVLLKFTVTASLISWLHICSCELNGGLMYGHIVQLPVACVLLLSESLSFSGSYSGCIFGFCMISWCLLHVLWVMLAAILGRQMSRVSPTWEDWWSLACTLFELLRDTVADL